jgi:ketosteroid isomerase-like protein
MSMSIEENVRIVKGFFAAIGRGDKQAVRALCAEDIEWIIPGEDWPLAGTRRGHAGLGFFDDQCNRVECAPNPFSAKVSAMSPV